ANKLAHVNLIPLNPTPGSRWDASPKPVEREFVRWLRASGVAATGRAARWDSPPPPRREWKAHQPIVSLCKILLDSPTNSCRLVWQVHGGGKERRNSDQSGSAIQATRTPARIQSGRGGRVPRPRGGHSRGRVDGCLGVRPGGARRRLPGPVRWLRRVAGGPPPRPR